MNALSIVIITFNSEKYLYEVLTSCSFADEVIILDSGSTDKTISIAQSFPNVNIIHQSWLGFGFQKQEGVNQARHDWVFVLDSDEVITAELQNEIIFTCNHHNHQGYFIPRINYFFGKPITRMGLHPDKTLRFFNRKHAIFSQSTVHEKVLLSGSCGYLKSPMLHYAYENIEQFITKQNNYSSLGAKNNRFKALFNPSWTFFKLFILKGGFLEGWRGFVIAKLYAQYTFWKYIK